MKIPSLFKNRLRIFSLSASAMLMASVIAACDEDERKIGPSLTMGDTEITLDSITYNLDAKSVSYDNYDARSGNLLLGNMNVPEYGSLKCSFVTKLMCVTSLNLPDSIALPERVDSCKFLLGMGRGDLTGDSLTPQKLAIYRLNKQLPASINNSFDPTGYYDPENPVGVQSFTASQIAQSDSIFLKNGGFFIEINVNKEVGQEVFRKYKEDPEVFQWPQTFSEYFPGIYAEAFFGKGCVSNIQNMYFAIYFYTFVEKSTTVDGETKKEWVKTPDVVFPFSSSPEVLSSNNISYKVSDYLKDMTATGQNVITTPGGYFIKIKFPAKELIERYHSTGHNLSMVNNLAMSIPAEAIENDYGINVTPSILLVKTSEMEDFFANNKLPDNKTSFSANYNSADKKYTFSSMRQYIVDLIEKGEVTDDDVEFTIVPVNMTYETEQNTYNGAETTYPTKCTPYTIKPTMTRMHTEEAQIVFSFSSHSYK